MSTAYPLVTAEELRLRLAADDDRRPTLLDVRYEPGMSDGSVRFGLGHLPGAAYVDLETALSGEARADGRGGRHPMPNLRQFKLAMRRASVTEARPVVCYDAGNSIAASRCWWLLRHFGKSDVQVLDGGLAAWERAGYEIETGQGELPLGDLVARPGGTRLLDAVEVPAYARRSALLDARPRARFAGEGETLDPVAGHIPGARSVPAVESIAPDGRLRPLDELERDLGVLVGGDFDVAVYCGSGVQATHLALVLAATGVAHDAGVYIGSFSDWISDPQRPVERGYGDR